MTDAKSAADRSSDAGRTSDAEAGPRPGPGPRPKAGPRPGRASSPAPGPGSGAPRRLLGHLGPMVGAAGLVFVIWQALRQGLPAPLAATPGTALGTLLAATGLQLLGAVLTGIGWVVLLRLTVRPTMRRSCLFGIFLYTQLDRYRLANVVQYVHRHAALAPFGVTIGESLTVAMAEALCLLTATGLLVGTAAALGRLDWSLSFRILGEFSLAVSGMAGFALLVMVVLQRSVISRLFASRRAVTRMLFAVGLDVATFVTMGLALDALIGVVAPDVARDLVSLSAICAAAWLAGFVVPGAPAGLGVREVVLTVLLAPAVGGDAAAIALALRLAGVLADALAAGAGRLMMLHAHPRPPVGADAR
ncbi:hypothetical protein PQJ75_18415 [Rhodoplanes sp. TEM]|uniref:Uncharacterized protein n=1 Tax=Rhodoplanes tepidamans TaxID=200616 RepID=A0ABT5J7K5_RHOTP|nr:MULTISPECIES: hypothetical protein [Rhodoplanes]MDC7785609.1 hypothetical protein [Rhodoplanes tepidamans]MDC7985710.1 hypothetical protein [Rhodoplanes sp. TEM]MDQ0354825.1 hypothetical protein [Rhodoplanes tepidamans]